MSDPFASAGQAGDDWEDTDQQQDRRQQSRPEPGQAIRPFHPVDLVPLAKAGIPAPELLCDELLYRGGLHSLAGPPDCGKSTLLYRWMLGLLAQGETVVLFDEESGQEQVVEKLLALGGEPHHLERLVYVEFPGRQWDDADKLGLQQLLARTQPAMVGFDSSSAFLTLGDRDEDRAPDVTAFYKGVLLQAAREHNTAVVVLDHIPKDLKNGRYARGSGAKLATVDVAVMVDAIKPFNRHQSGLLKLRVTKDRRGYLHRAFEVRVHVEDGQLALEVERVEGEHDPKLAGLSPAAVKVLEVLRAAGEPLTVARIGDAVKDRYEHGLKRTTVSEALNDLSDRGLVDGAGEPGKQKHWWAMVSEVSEGVGATGPTGG